MSLQYTNWRRQNSSLPTLSATRWKVERDDGGVVMARVRVRRTGMLGVEEITYLICWKARPLKMDGASVWKGRTPTRICPFLKHVRN